MTKLTQISIVTRKIIRYTVYGIIGIILLRGAILTAIKIYRYYFPEPPPPPTVAFGKLPALPFPQKDNPQNLTFRLETAAGELPKFPLSSHLYRCLNKFLSVFLANIAPPM